MGSKTTLEDFDKQFGWDTLFEAKEEVDDVDRDLSSREIIYNWERVFKAIGTPEYKDILMEASDLFIELPEGDYMDPKHMMHSYAKAIAYRNKLIRIKIKLRRIFSAKSRSFASMSRSVIGKQKGTRPEKEAKAADQLAVYEAEAGDAKDALDTINDIIDNLDSTAMQLSRILKLMEMRPNSYYTSMGASAFTEEENEEVAGDWGSAGSLNRQLFRK